MTLTEDRPSLESSLRGKEATLVIPGSIGGDVNSTAVSTVALKVIGGVTFE